MNTVGTQGTGGVHQQTAASGPSGVGTSPPPTHDPETKPHNGLARRAFLKASGGALATSNGGAAGRIRQLLWSLAAGSGPPQAEVLAPSTPLDPTTATAIAQVWSTFAGTLRTIRELENVKPAGSSHLATSSALDLYAASGEIPKGISQSDAEALRKVLLVRGQLSTLRDLYESYESICKHLLLFDADGFKLHQFLEQSYSRERVRELVGLIDAHAECKHNANVIRAVAQRYHSAAAQARRRQVKRAPDVESAVPATLSSLRVPPMAYVYHSAIPIVSPYDLTTRNHLLANTLRSTLIRSFQALSPRTPLSSSAESEQSSDALAKLREWSTTKSFPITRHQRELQALANHPRGVLAAKILQDKTTGISVIEALEFNRLLNGNGMIDADTDRFAAAAERLISERALLYHASPVHSLKDLALRALIDPMEPALAATFLAVFDTMQEEHWPEILRRNVVGCLSTTTPSRPS